MKKTTITLLTYLAWSIPAIATAQAAETNQVLTRCLVRAEQLPDQTLAEAENWIKTGGGDSAWVCHAFAQFHRGEFRQAAHEFMALAAKREKKAPKQAAAYYVQAGLAAMRAGDHETAEKAYAAAIKLEPHDPEVWIDRATQRASTEHYWEALSDIDRALDIMPEMPEALRLRAQIRTKLGQDHSAKTDFEHAAAIESAETPAQPKSQ